MYNNLFQKILLLIYKHMYIYIFIYERHSNKLFYCKWGEWRGKKKLYKYKYIYNKLKQKNF